jgi:hypothetical protein
MRWDIGIGIGGALLLLTAALWSLFGWTPEYQPSLGKTRIYRSWGQKTEAQVDTNRDGRLDTRLLYYSGGALPPAGCPADHQALWEDRDHDGRWDTWMEVQGSDGQGGCRVLWSADTDGDGVRDRERTAVWSDDSGPIYEELKQQRGF